MCIFVCRSFVKLLSTFFLSASFLQAFLRPETPATSLMHPTILAEVRMTTFVVHHNRFFNLSDHLTLYINNEFKSSRAAENFSCGRTKTAAVVNYVRVQFQLDLITDLKKVIIQFDLC